MMPIWWVLLVMYGCTLGKNVIEFLIAAFDEYELLALRSWSGACPEGEAEDSDTSVALSRSAEYLRSMFWGLLDNVRKSTKALLSNAADSRAAASRVR